MRTNKKIILFIKYFFEAFDRGLNPLGVTHLGVQVTHLGADVTHTS